MLADLSWMQKISVTALTVGASTGLRIILGASANPVPFVTYFPAILLIAAFLGWRWAAIATVMSAGIVSQVFLARPWLDDPSSSDLAILAFFCLSCSVLVLTGDTLRRAVRHMDELLRERDMFHQEMRHRIQNTITVVTAMVRLSKAVDVSQFREDLLGRLLALSQSNRVLEAGSSEGTAVPTLIRQAVAPFAHNDAITMDGPPIHLPARAGQHLLLIVHELCTNALKHGALSRSDGSVQIVWSDTPFFLEWQEAGGPLVSPPSHAGLGSRLFASQSVFSVDVRYEREGVRCLVHLRC
jgi:two-component sensor histidine kinase